MRRRDEANDNQGDGAMERAAGVFPPGRGRVAALGALCLVVVAVGGLLLVTSSGAETEGKPGEVRTPAGSNAGVAATSASTTTTSTTPFVPVPAASPTGSTGAGSAPSTPLEASAPAPAPAQFLLVCESPVVDENGTETSSSVVAWVPEGTPIPAGCHRG